MKIEGYLYDESRKIVQCTIDNDNLQTSILNYKL